MPTPPPTSAGSGPPQPRTASPTTGALARCDRHRERFAEWLCAHCGKGWCDECGLVTRAVSSKVQLVQCPACRDRCVASPRRERRVQREQKANHDRLSIPWAIGEGAKRPFAGGYEIFVWLGIGFLYAVGSASAMYAGTMSIILRLLPVPFMLRIVRHAARGEKGFPEPGDVTDWMWDLIIPALAFVAGCWLVALPAGLYAALRPGPIADVASDPIFWLLFGVGLFYLPAVIVTTAMTDSVGAALNPGFAVRLLARVRGDYLVLLVGAFVMSAGSGLVARLVPAPISYLWPWLDVYLVLATMSVYGNVLYRRRGQLGIEV
ncbi:MAG: DUF4013 domain-containing protein [Deltaproteobacteria bacterium]|nr:DUF4013 domain-containing protein [Deltaproteobacteria bacterium]